jgi:predicted nucleotidyltransferase
MAEADSRVSLQKLYQRLNVMPDQISNFCQKWHLAEFALFGSVLREDFRIDGESPSDVDVLFTYGKNARKNLILQAHMKFELEDMFHRTVDLVSKTAILNDPNDLRRQHILESARIIYAER